MLGHRELSMEDYVGMLRRRWVLIAIPTVLGPLIGYGVSLVLQERYTSQTLVLVEQQKVPEKFISSVVNDDFNQRLSTMQERILSRTQLQPIIEKYDLFKGDASLRPMEDLVDKARLGIKVATVRTLGGRATAEVPGFTISFTYSEARTAQQVCQEITSMFIEENLRVRGEKAANTAKFLENQLGDAKRKLDEQDARLADFQRRNIGQMPGSESTSLGMLMGGNAQLDAVTQLIQRTQQDKSYMETLLAQQVAALQTAPGGANPQTLDRQLAQLQGELVTLEGRYTDTHPDVTKKRNEIAQIQKRIEDLNKAAKAQPSQPMDTATVMEPPQIAQLRNQIRQLDQTLKEKTREQQRLQEAVRIYQARVQMTPTVEQEYKELTRDYDIALGFYNDLLYKKTQAELSHKLETTQQGEQFRVMDAANLPTSPSFPDRLLFSAGGLGGGLLLGLSVMLLLEMKDKTMRTDMDLVHFLDLPALAHIPLVGAAAPSGGWILKRSRKAEEAGRA